MYRTYFGGEITLHVAQTVNNITCSTDCKYRTAATMCTVETWFVSGIIVNTLYKGDNKDDDDDDDDNNKLIEPSPTTNQTL